IDWPKAAVFLRHLVGLPAAQCAHLCALVLPRARRWTTSEISRRLRRLILEIDPAHYERLFRRAHARRAVSACVTEDGTVTITAHGVAPEDADAAVARIDRLAHQVRRGGHPGRLDQIRVDLFVGFLDGRLHTLTDAQIITALLHDAASESADSPAGQVPARSTGRPRSAPAGRPATSAPTSGADEGTQRPGTMAPPASSPSDRTEPPGASSTQSVHPERTTAKPSTAGRSAADRSTAGRTESERNDAAHTNAAHTNAAHTEAAHTEAAQAEIERTEIERREAERAETGRDATASAEAADGEAERAEGRAERGSRLGPLTAAGSEGSEATGEQADRNGTAETESPANPRRGVHVQIALSTLLGLDERP
ncbi:hypothetical protein LWC33_34660, partial [Pseudonocardia sp. RS11V-5]|nr:hypothetical protein [Pseudonocardia terrae]